LLLLRLALRRRLLASLVLGRRLTLPIGSGRWRLALSWRRGLPLPAIRWRGLPLATAAAFAAAAATAATASIRRRLLK
jgi:hypothetical protein